MPTSRTAAVVTGLGAVTPYGIGVEPLWNGLLAGRSTARRISRFDPSDHAVQIACEVPGFEPTEHLPRRLARQLDPFAQYALVAAAEALGQAGLLADAEGMHWPLGDQADSRRVGVVIASGIGAIQEATDQHERLRTGGPRRVRPYLAIALPLNMAGGQVAIRHGLRGPNYAVVSACASASDAIGSALDLIRADRADVVVAGGAEAAVNPLTIAGFAAAGALSRRNAEPARASRPFDLDRDGFVTGEGAGVVVLERPAHAAARRATVLAEVSGYGISNDAYHPTQPAPDGDGATVALRLALDDAGLGTSDVDHINAHGTSTWLNDAAEAAAVRAVFASQADRIPVTSTKSAIGHLLGAAGGVEAVATVMALADGVVPTTLNLERRDPACDLDVVSGEPRKQALRTALSTSFGFGGHNAVLAFQAV
ncbi:MAG: beta-ketoacyl-ACP synthase II [Actinomycetota bacterium]|nr:beta-ketoacyl-ACP synthase II [Actinomycetota bacterium]